jgi:hypothetical protein
MIDKVKALGGSKRFWAGLITSVLIYVNSQINLLPGDQMLAITGVIISMIVGDSIKEIGGK